MSGGRLGFFLVTLVGAVAGRAHGQTVRPRFLILVDSSGSMTENPGRVRTHGDGSITHPGCDLDGNGKYDDSKLYQAKVAFQDTIAAFGSAEFALGRFRQNELGQTCITANDCLNMNK